MEELGAGEILITTMDRDGTLGGYDIELIQGITQKTEILVIASGGAGSLSHMLEGLIEDRAHALAAASMFHFTQLTPKEVKLCLKKHHIPVREQ